MDSEQGLPKTVEDYVTHRRLFERLNLIVPEPDVERVLQILRDPVASAGCYLIWSGIDGLPHPETTIEQYLVLVDREIGVSPKG